MIAWALTLVFFAYALWKHAQVEEERRVNNALREYRDGLMARLEGCHEQLNDALLLAKRLQAELGLESSTSEEEIYAILRGETNQ